VKPEPEVPAPKKNWVVIALHGLKMLLPFAGKFFPYAGVAYAVIDILLKIFG
jgi:hypothetical protein